MASNFFEHCGHLLGKDRPLGSIYEMSSCVFVTFPYGVLGQVFSKVFANSADTNEMPQSVANICISICYFMVTVYLSTCLKIVSMIRNYQNHKPQTTPWHREEKPLNHHETPGRQIKQINQLSLPHQDDCKTRRNIK